MSLSTAPSKPETAAPVGKRTAKAARRILTAKEPKTRFSDLDRRTRRFITGSFVTLLATAVLGVYLLPLGFMTLTSLKSEEQIALSTVLPRAARTVEYTTGDVELVEISDDGGELAAISVVPAGDGGPDAIPFTWRGDWTQLFDRIETAGADPSEVQLIEIQPGGLTVVLPGIDPASLAGAGEPAAELDFDGTEAGLVAALAETGYDLEQVGLFTLPPVQDDSDQVTAIALLRPGAAVDALADPRSLPTRVEWDATIADLDTQLQSILGITLNDATIFAVTNDDGGFDGVGLLPRGADADPLLDRTAEPVEAIPWAGTVEDLSSRLDTALGLAPQELALLLVPDDDGSTRELALLQPGPSSSLFVDPATPDAEPIRWEGRIQTLDPVTDLSPTVENFPDAWDRIDFGRKLRNTAIIAGLGMAGTVLSSTLVAYGLSRFRVPYKNLILLSLVATIILPRFVTLVPTYIVFERIGWVGTWWPLIVPHFFANAYNVFLLRQFFLTIPRDLDEAASIDGAGPLTVLFAIILPQAKGAILAVALFHFFFAWNDFLEPLLYLSAQPDRQPIAVGLYFFLGLYDDNLPLIQSGALLGMAIPIVVFLALQRVFLSGIDLSGSMK